MATKLSDQDLDELLGLADDETVDESEFPALVNTTVGRYADRTTLTPYLGGVYLAAELVEIKHYGGLMLPMTSLPRIVPKSPSSPLTYRSRMYGPYDHIDSPSLLSPLPVYTFRSAVHRGQTKLCAIEIEAITLALRKYPGLKYVLYAGAAPGEHIVFLAEIFPQLEFHLVDPAVFRVHNRYKKFPGVEKRIHVTRALFTGEEADKWRTRAIETFFISDIRSGDHNQEEFEREVWTNMQMQLGWWKRVNFAASLFKFRLPYTDGIVVPKCKYLDGDILIQPCAPNVSTEGRLLVWRDAESVIYNSMDYENYYFWLNNIIREWASFDHGLSLNLVPGLCRCFDCARIVQIFRGYVEDHPIDSELFDDDDTYIAYLIGRMVDATEQHFLVPPHGIRVDEFPADKRLDNAVKYGRSYEQKRARKIQSRQQSVQYAPPVVQTHVRPPPRARGPSLSRGPPPRARGPSLSRGPLHASLDQLALQPVSSYKPVK